MNCMNCGALLTSSHYCPNCGFHVEVQKKVWQLSNLYYNRGLEKAEIRDLSGAIDLLKRSLKFNKLNILDDTFKEKIEKHFLNWIQRLSPSMLTV